MVTTSGSVDGHHVLERRVAAPCTSPSAWVAGPRNERVRTMVGPADTETSSRTRTRQSSRMRQARKVPGDRYATGDSTGCWSPRPCMTWLQEVLAPSHSGHGSSRRTEFADLGRRPVAIHTTRGVRPDMSGETFWFARDERKIRRRRRAADHEANQTWTGPMSSGRPTPPSGCPGAEQLTAAVAAEIDEPLEEVRPKTS